MNGGAIASLGRAGSSAPALAMSASGGTVASGGAGGVLGMAGVSGSSDVLHHSSGCGLEPPTTDTSIQVGAMRSSYIIDRPKNYDKSRAYPLLMVFRGANVTADQFRGYLNLPAAAGADALMVHPNCLNDATAWDVQRDLPMVDALLAQLEATYCIDERRVFAVGHTSGGFFTNALGCMRGDKLRGIAPLSAGPPLGMCQGEFAVWMSQGNADMSLTSGRAARDFWAKRNNCNATQSIAVDPAPCTEFAGCDAGFAVRYCEYDGDLGLPAFAATGLWGFFKQL
jgi:poly(3-hydroxybutyrate) depolymerase